MMHATLRVSYGSVRVPIMPNIAARPLPSPLNDAARLAALDSLGVIDAGPDAALDNLVQLAAEFCEAPIALVTLVDDVRQVFKAKQGFEGEDEAPLHVGYCPAVIEQGVPVVIPDTLTDPTYAANPAAQQGGMRFYAGVPLVGDDQQVLGTLCVLDKAPRPNGLTPRQLKTLQALATQVLSQFELRRTLVVQQAVIRERETLAQVQAAIVAAEGDLDTILAALVAGAMQAVPAAEAGVIELIDGDHLEYRTVGGTLMTHRGLRVPLNGSLAGSCALTNTPILVNDVTCDPRAGHDLIARLDLRSAVFAPIARGAKVLGVLKLQASKPGRFTAHDLQLVGLFAGSVTAGLTEVRAAEAHKAIQASEARYRAIFESAGDFAIVATDPEGRIIEWNGGAERVMGWSAEEMRGQNAERFFTPEDRATDRISIEMATALAEGRANNERWHLKKSGARFYASGEMMPLRDPDGAHLGFIKILRDRTEQHQAGAALAESEARYRTLFESIDEGFCVVEFIDGPHGPLSDYVHVEANHAYEKNTGIAGVVGQTIRGMAPGEADGWVEIYGEVLRTGTPARFEREFKLAGRYIEVTANRVEPAARRQVAILFNDISNRVRAAELQEVLNRELSHRMKNILAMVQAIVTQTLRTAPDMLTAREALVARLISLGKAHDVLMRGAGETADLLTVIESALEVHDDRQQGRFRIEGPMVICGAQPALSVSLMMHELATNAVKYGALSRPDGHVSITWSLSGPADAQQLTLVWREHGGPVVALPSRQGFGSKLIERGLAGAVGGVAKLDYPTTGVTCTLTAPLAGFRVETV